jgi:putative ABC transport system ATP-binding protein
MAIFQQLHQDGRTVIMITHDRDVAEHANRVIVLDDGQIAEDEFVEQPRDAAAELAALAVSEEVA